MPHLQADEQKILEVKYASVPIKNLGDPELQLHTQALLLKIHVITGWKLTDNEIKQTILENQLMLKLKEDYGNVNTSEIEFAFRKYGKLVKEWGKELNLNLIDDVLDEYLKRREDVSAIEERLLKAPEKEKPTDEQLLSEARECIEDYYQKFLQGRLQSFKLLPNYAIAHLALDGYCSFDLYEMFLTKAQELIGKEILSEIEDLKMRRKNLLIADKEMELCDLSVDSNRVINLAKRMALVYFFNEAKKSGLKQLYEKV